MLLGIFFVVVGFFFLSKALIILACVEKRVLYHQMKSNMFFQEHLAIQRKTWNHSELSRKAQISGGV